jgi:hypothetical protein
MKLVCATVLVGLLLGQLSAPGAPAVTNLYSTDFEGYDPLLDLSQQGWSISGSGGNGVLTNGIDGQSAYLGFTPPNTNNDALVLWQPVNFDAVAAGYPIVTCSVLFNIIDSSTTTNRDIFRWSVYNTVGDRLFAIDFDNQYRDIAYVLDGTNQPVFTDLRFLNDTNYTLAVTMDFALNRWSASYNGIPIAANQPITTTNALLDFGDLDAVWLVNLQNGTNAPGDNFMLFDNYQITAERDVATLEFLGRTPNGWSLLQGSGVEGSRWAVDATTDFVNWVPLKTNRVEGGYFDLIDRSASGLSQRFYRGRKVP